MNIADDHSRDWALRWAVFVTIVGTCAGGFAQALPDDEAVRAARDGLRGHAQFPWYDARNDRIRRIEVAPPRDRKNRQSAPGNWTWPSSLARLGEVGVWLLIALLLAALVYAMVRTFLQREATASSAAASNRPRPANADRFDSLPFQLARPDVNLLEEAKRLRGQGRYGEAIVYLYSFQLVQLDQHQLIRLARGKTNRQYLREISRRPLLRSLLETTIVAFEDFFFGDHALDRPQFESCWNRLEEFQREIELSLGKQ